MPNDKRTQNDIARERDEVLRRMIATPPKPHKAMKRRPAKAAEGRQLEKRRTNVKRATKD